MRAWFRNLRRFVTYNAETKVGFSIVLTFLAVVIAESIGGYSILPYNPLRPNVGRHSSPPSLSHLFGTTPLGHDIFSQVIAGAPNDAMVSFFVVGTAVLFGGLLGSLAGLAGGIVDDLLMRITDIFFAIPPLVLGLAIAVVLGPSPVNVMVALSVIWWPPYARFSRSEALKVYNAHFVESARLSGLGTGRIVLRHILPISATPLLVYATLDVGTVILAYSGLAYLGLAVRPPYPDWGDMVARYQEYIIASPWMSLIPSIIILIIAAGFSLLGDGLRAAVQAQRGR